MECYWGREYYRLRNRKVRQPSSSKAGDRLTDYFLDTLYARLIGREVWRLLIGREEWILTFWGVIDLCRVARSSQPWKITKIIIPPTVLFDFNLIFIIFLLDRVTLREPTFADRQTDMWSEVSWASYGLWPPSWILGPRPKPCRRNRWDIYMKKSESNFT